MLDMHCDLCGHASSIFQYHVDSCDLVCGTCLHIERQQGGRVSFIVLRALGFLHRVRAWQPLRDQALALINHDRTLRGEVHG